MKYVLVKQNSIRQVILFTVMVVLWNSVWPSSRSFCIIFSVGFIGIDVKSALYVIEHNDVIWSLFDVSYKLWLDWWAFQLDTPHWWEELTAILEVEDLKKLTQ